jgi:CubicO group peptidase (beta-lactamase class C family)
VYDLASLTKPLFAAAVALRLAAAGRVDLDRPLDDLLPELSGYAGSTPSLDTLLTHRSGLPAWAPLYRRLAAPGDVLRGLGSLEPCGAAGGEPVYSCLGAIAAGIVLERASGLAAAELLRSEVIEPLGLDPEDLSYGPVLRDACAPTEKGRQFEMRMAGAGERGWAIVPGPDEVVRGEVHDGNARWLGGRTGNAGLFGTASAAFRVLSAMASGEVAWLDPGLRRRAARPLAGSVDEVRTFGFQHGDTPTAPVPRDVPAAEGAFGHVGFTGTSAWVFPRADAVVVLLTNRVHPIWREAPVQQWRREFHREALRVLGKGCA